jgi:hypothetical protein
MLDKPVDSISKNAKTCVMKNQTATEAVLFSQCREEFLPTLLGTLRLWGFAPPLEGEMQGGDCVCRVARSNVERLFKVISQAVATEGNPVSPLADFHTAVFPPECPAGQDRLLLGGVAQRNRRMQETMTFDCATPKELSDYVRRCGGIAAPVFFSD